MFSGIHWLIDKCVEDCTHALCPHFHAEKSRCHFFAPFFDFQFNKMSDAHVVEIEEEINENINLQWLEKLSGLKKDYNVDDSLIQYLQRVNLWMKSKVGCRKRYFKQQRRLKIKLFEFFEILQKSVSRTRVFVYSGFIYLREGSTGLLLMVRVLKMLKVLGKGKVPKGKGKRVR